MASSGRRKKGGRTTIADTSFYVFFIDDIDGIEYLAAIARSCMLVATALVMKELSRKRHAGELRGMVAPAGFDYHIAEALRPFFNGRRPVRGEHEVIALGHLMHKRGVQFTVIIDDGRARVLFNIRDRVCFLIDRLPGPVNSGIVKLPEILPGAAGRFCSSSSSGAPPRRR